GELVLLEEHGDTYSDEAGHRRALCQPSGPFIVEQKSEFHSVLRYACELTWNEVHFSALVRLLFDQSPLVRWQVEIDSRGTDFRVEMLFRMARPGQVYAGMPFDVVQRPTEERDLLPRELPEELAKVLLGQRELGAVSTFPFHDFVALSSGASSAVILAKGLRAYRADDDGTLTLTLRRAVEWLTAADLPHRVGDAGPFFYVPDARCERKVSHELAAFMAEGALDEIALQHLNAGFQNPPLIVQARGGGEQAEWSVFQEGLPLSSLYLHDGNLLARLFNPTTKEVALRHEYLWADVIGQLDAPVRTILPKQIATIGLSRPLPAEIPDTPDAGIVSWDEPAWRVGKNHGLPDPRIIEQLQEKIAQLEDCLSQIEEQLVHATARERYLLEHRYYVLKRELYEFRLSVRLNELKRDMR
ncbi:MAG: hypothetical protein ACRDIB_10480, partial [Ardenticatenaceae bacterium]